MRKLFLLLFIPTPIIPRSLPPAPIWCGGLLRLGKTALRAAAGFKTPLRAGYGILVWEFIVFIFPLVCSASIEISLSPQAAWQGKTVVVSVGSVEGVASVEGLFLGQRFRLFPDGEDFKGLVGIPTDQKPGEYNFRLTITREDGLSFEIDKTVKVWATAFGKVWFHIPPAKKKVYLRKLIEEEWLEIEKALLTGEGAQHWEGEFLMPVNNVITMAFGTQEYVNGKKSGRHRGTDLRAKAGTPVQAPNQGRVVFAKYLKAFGGTLVIDHGRGIHTLYFHLSKMLKPAGRLVSRGEIIAETGNSGISTGPHLHWGLSVHNLRVDPMQWTRQKI